MPIKPSEREEEYFARVEAEKKKKLAEEKAKTLAIQDREELKKLHWMRCPKCGMELQTVTYQSIEIDRCFNCNGTWLDKGELEKIAALDSSATGIISGIRSIFK